MYTVYRVLFKLIKSKHVFFLYKHMYLSKETRRIFMSSNCVYVARFLVGVMDVLGATVLEKGYTCIFMKTCP